MSNFIVPNVFVPGTKAKAQDVNENFSSVQDELNSKADKTGDVSQTFNVSQATENNHAVNKSQLEGILNNEKNELKNEIDFITDGFLITSGNVNSSGEPDIINFDGYNGIVSFKIDDGTNYAPLNCISGNNKEKFTLTSVDSTDISSYANGTYNVYISPDGNAYVYNNEITYQTSIPTNPTLNDIFVNISTKPFKVQKYDGSEWVDFDNIYLGSVTVADGVVTTCTHAKFNDNGINVIRTNQKVVEECYKNGSSWYRLWSDGWCEQGGIQSYSGSIVNAYFLKRYVDENYSANLTFSTSNNTQRNCYLVNKGVANIRIGGYTDTTITVHWNTCGYIR